MKYPFRVYQTQIESHVFWVAECPALKGCVGQGDTLDEAIAELEINEQSWIEVAKECGIEVPPIPMENMNAYSGKLTLRVAPHVHQEAAELAKKQGVSLNQYINDAIVAQNARISTVGYIVPEVQQAIRFVKELISVPSESYTNGSASTVRFNTRQNAQTEYKVSFGPELAPYLVSSGT